MSPFQKNIQTFVSQQSTKLRIATYNINGLNNKFSEIEFLLEQQMVEILVINETKINKSHDDKLFENPHYHFYRRDREENQGGGIAVYIRKTLKVKSLIIHKDIEMISFTVKLLNNRNISVLAIYRPEAITSEIFFPIIEKRISELHKSSDDIMIVGDINFDMLVDNKLADFCNTHGFGNTIKTGTRLNPQTMKTTLLDCILCHQMSSFIKSQVFESDLSDHYLAISIFEHHTDKSKSQKVLSRCLSQDKILQIWLLLLTLLPVCNLSQYTDPNKYWFTMKSVITACMDKCCPYKPMNVRSGTVAPWYDKDLVTLAKQRNRLYKKAVRSKSKSDWSLQKSIRKKFYNLFRLKKSNYFHSMIHSLSSSSKKLWKKIQPYINPNKKTKIIPGLLLPNTFSTDLDVAEVFSTFFRNITDRFTFLPVRICLGYVDKFFNSCISLLSLRQNTPIFKFLPFEVDEVERVLLSLDTSSASGSCDIDTCVLVACIDQLKIPLTDLFNLCLISGVIPDEWKIAHVTPVYKGSGTKSDLDNYRPISIISPIAKVFEKLLAERIQNHFESNGLLTENQYSFRKGLSCELALNTLIDSWKEQLDQKNFVISIFLDLSKAFDTIDHNILLRKLEFYNFNKEALLLIKNYLSNRSAVIKLNGSLSKKQEIKVGLPQGSILGPLLFIIFVNDLCHLQISSDLNLFADDITGSAAGKTVDDVLKLLTIDLIVICEWLKHNRLVINWKKTHAILFNFNTKHHIHDYRHCELFFDGIKIEFLENTKMLGVIIDHNLDFKEHIRQTCNKVNGKTKQLQKSAFMFTMNFKTTLFKSFIQSKFDYCSTLLTNNTYQIKDSKLIKCFNSSVNRLLNANIGYETLSVQLTLLKPYNLLPLQLRSFLRYNVFIHNLLTKNKHTKLAIKINNYVQTRNLKSHYIIPNFVSNHYKFSFTTLSIKLLNNYLCSNINLSKNSFIFLLTHDILNLYDITSSFWS